MEKTLLINFSGGETSAYMAWWLINVWPGRLDHQIVCVFANTGEENEQTLEFADRCDKEFGLNLVWVESIFNSEFGKGVAAKVVDYKSASRNGEPFEAMIKKFGIPNMNWKHCSRELKTSVIRAYMRSIGFNRINYKTAIGIRNDEIDRINPRYKKERLIYPLISLNPSTKIDVNRFWRDMPFRLQLKGYEGNCKVCWKKSLRKLLTIAKHNPAAFNSVKKWEQKYGSYVPPSRHHNEKIKPPFRFFRDNLSVDDILALSQQPFEEALDDSMVYVEYKQTMLFGHELDRSNGCSESCEAF